MQLVDAIKARKSVKRFSEKKPDWRTVIQCIDAGRYAPMAGNMFSLKFILVSDEKKIDELVDASQQKFVKAPYVLVIVSDDAKVVRSYDNRGKGYSRQQAGAAIENILLALTDKGLATCWVGYFEDSQVKRALKIPNDMNVEALLPIGFETKVSTGQPKSKPDLEDVLYFETWKNKYMTKDTKVQVFGNLT